jgi:hypothetical protein
MSQLIVHRGSVKAATKQENSLPDWDELLLWRQKMLQNLGGT